MSAVCTVLLFLLPTLTAFEHDKNWCSHSYNQLGPEDLKTLGTKCTSTYQNQHGQEGYARQVVDLCLLRNGNVTNPVNLLNFGECMFNTIYHSCLDTDPKTTITHACHYSSQLESMDDVNQNCEKFATDCFEKYETFVKPKFTDIQREVPTWCTKKSDLLLNSTKEETGIETAIRCIELDESVNTSEPDNSWWARKRDQHLMCTMQSIFSSEHKSKSSSKTAMLEACEFYKTFGLIGSCEEFTEKCYSKLSDVYPELMETNSMQSTCGTENGNHLDPKQIISIWSRLSGNSIAEGCQRLYSEVDTSNFTENAGYCTYNTIFTLWRHDPIEAKKQFESACEYYENDQGKGFAPNCAEFSSKCLEHYSVTDNVTNVEDKVADWCSSDAEFVEIPCPQDEYCGNEKVLKCYEKMGATSFSNWITDSKAASCSFRSGFNIADENKSKIIMTDTCLFYTRLGYKGDCKAFTEKCYTALHVTKKDGREKEREKEVKSSSRDWVGVSLSFVIVVALASL